MSSISGAFGVSLHVRLPCKAHNLQVKIRDSTSQSLLPVFSNSNAFLRRKSLSRTGLRSEKTNSKSISLNYCRKIELDAGAEKVFRKLPSFVSSANSGETAKISDEEEAELLTKGEEKDEKDIGPPSQVFSTEPSPLPENSVLGRATSIGIFFFWAALTYYLFQLAPNQTPFRDRYFVEKLVGLRSDDGFIMNQVWVNLWNAMGLWPLFYSSLLIPAARTDRTKVPIWPFCAGSVAFGAFTLLPFFALWNPGQPKFPTEEERQGWPLKIMESKITAVAALLATSAILIGAATSPTADWIEYYQYIRESRLIHVTTADFFILTTMAPFWLYNDMSFRKWAPRDSWGLALLAIPVLGPAFYLVLRPPLPSEGKSSNPE